MTTSSMPKFPEWLDSRSAVRDAAAELWSKLPAEKDPTKAQQALGRLITKPLMKRVWQDLYKKSRSKFQDSKQYCHPACVNNGSIAARLRQRASELWKAGGKENEREAKYLEYEAAETESLVNPPADPRWSEQDLGVQLFLHHAYRDFLDVKPVFLSDLDAKAETMREVAEVLRKQAATLHSLGKESYVQKLQDIASSCDNDARCILPRDGEDPWIITRQRGDAELRTFVADLSITTTTIFRKELHSTLANVANVLFDRPVTRETIREMLRSSARKR